MAASNLSGMNLSGMNLSGMNLGASNLSGMNMAASNLSGMNLSGMNLSGMNLAGADSGRNIHGLSQPMTGMLWSGEDLVSPKSNQCIVLGLGSTAFSRLLAQQSPSARLSVALGKLPWGFSSTAGGPTALEAWEAVVWGDHTYCTFVLAGPPGATWTGVAGFIKAVFRWNAPPSQSVDIGAIDASASVDPTMGTQILTYTGMMNAAARFLAGTIDETRFMAGELAFVTATTNNQSVMVDFSSWVEDTTGKGLVLANVDSVNPPTYAESVYYTYQNPDGTFGVAITRIGAITGVTSAYDELSSSYGSYRRGYNPKPQAIRCGGALFLNGPAYDSQPVPAGKCDSGLTFVEPAGVYPMGWAKWSSVAGTTAPMNAGMLLKAAAGTPFLRAPNQPVLSETYVFMWDPNHVLPGPDAGPAGGDRASQGVAMSNGANCGFGTEPAAAFDELTTNNRWCANGTPSPTAPRSLMYMWGASVAINSYRLYPTDQPTRTPMNWTFQGCNGSCTVGSDTGWVTLDTRSNQTFTTRWQPTSYSFTNSTAYQQYRLRITANAGNATVVELSEVDLVGSAAPVKLANVDKTENGTVHWNAPACNATEPASRAFDNLLTSAGPTRYCGNAVPSTTRPVSIGYSWGGSYVGVTSYAVTSASDMPARDARNWTFQGCAGSCQIYSDTGWDTLDTRSGVTFASRYQTQSFTLVSTGKTYTHYRLRVTANNGDFARLQIGEIQLY
jgi:hypothetical protein